MGLDKKIEETCHGEKTSDVLLAFATVLRERSKMADGQGLEYIVLSMLNLVKFYLSLPKPKASTRSRG